ncbi:CLUMA_CG020193, isoform A [Clunio marinus]|uniref:1-Cys peroxiredoxin n=1 Tax=Clunio marinus TaxID=568069 RepID=A0A1J1J5H9_9DIPT|nr:CLUMA_CG020193, isoform A [Clunio marinus]
MNLGESFPNFKVSTTLGDIDFHQWLGDSWGVLFSHPADFTPVCTTELSKAASISNEFGKRNTKIIALSCDPIHSHLEWIKDIQAYGKQAGEFPFPIIDDSSRELAVKLKMLDLDEIGNSGLPLTCRAVFIIDPKKRLRLSILYPASTGRNFDEIIRVLDSLQLTDQKKVATPVDWRQGGDCMILPTVKEEEIHSLFPEGVEMLEVPSGKKYIRITPCPDTI